MPTLHRQDFKQCVCVCALARIIYDNVSDEHDDEHDDDDNDDEEGDYDDYIMNVAVCGRSC